MTQKLIIFDFDGTIADTVDALVTIANGLAEEFGYLPITPEELILLRGFTSRQIIKYCGISLLKIPFLVTKVRKELKHQVHEFKPIPGIKPALIDLHHQAYKLGIITSNYRENVTAFLENHDLNRLFDFIHSGATIFGKTSIINSVLREEQIPTDDVIYVGDETRDIEASKKANIKVIAVSWGFNSPEVLAQQNPDILIHHPWQLLPAIKKCDHLVKKPGNLQDSSLV